MTKFKLHILCALVAALTAAPLHAQPKSGTEQTQANLVIPRDPNNQVSDFFRILSEGRVDAAYDLLLQGTHIAAMPKDVATLKAKTREATKVFGDINGYELVDQKGVGQHLTRLTCLSLCKNLPIRWRFYFYKANDLWKLVDIRIDDRLPDLFGEEPADVIAPVK